MDRTELGFPSGDAWCAAWLYRPATVAGRLPCVVMAHGFSLTRHDGLPRYAEAFCAAGFAVLVYDHRFLGDSHGEPRQRVHLRELLEDRRSAVAFARSIHGIDPDRIVVWGYSMSAGSAVEAAAEDPRIAAAILVCPLLDGRWRAGRALVRDPIGVAWLMAQAARDLVGYAVIPAGWRDITVSAAAIDRFHRKAACAVVKHYDIDHFGAFHGELSQRVIAEQVEWLQQVGGGGH